MASVNSALGNLISDPVSLDVSVPPDFRAAIFPVALVLLLSQEKSFLFSYLVVKPRVITSKLLLELCLSRMQPESWSLLL